LEITGANDKVTPSINPTTKSNKQNINKKSVPLSTSRITLIPSNCSLKIKVSRINKIYKELRGLEVKGFENSCAITFRVFLELSVENFEKTHEITSYPNYSLSRKSKE
jgi:hypothetical protein